MSDAMYTGSIRIGAVDDTQQTLQQIGANFKAVSDQVAQAIQKGMGTSIDHVDKSLVNIRRTADTNRCRGPITSFSSYEKGFCIRGLAPCLAATPRKSAI
jgi:hypothetical protein